MLLSNKYRLYPSNEQKELLDRHFGAVRFIFNLALETKKWAFISYRVNISRYDLQVQLKELKDDCPWLKEVNSQSLQAALLNLDTAYSNFFKGYWKFPNFKKSSGNQSFLCPQNVAVLNDGKLNIPKFKEGIKIVLHRPIKGIIKSATITKTSSNKYFASILTENSEKVPLKKALDITTTVGIDLGIKTFAVLSNGYEFKNPKYLKEALKRLNVLHRRVSIKKKNGSNRKKAVKRLSTLYERIANQRKDYLHKVSDAITKQYDTICIEDLSVKNMVKNRNLSQPISDANTCGSINRELSLKDREWVCPNCGEIVFRDVNAAINIKNFAFLGISGVERTIEPVELPTLVGALKQETTLLKRVVSSQGLRL